MLLYVLVLGNFCSAADGLKSINEYKRNYFKIISAEKGFNPIDEGLVNVKDQFIIYNGYLSDDFYSDIITLSKDRKSLFVYIYNNDKGTFQ